MNEISTPVLIPVENQVREFDPKLLLACVAARRGFPVFLGSRREMDFHIASFAPGFYLSKSMTPRSIKMFRILRRLGHQILAWDEEALVHLPPDTYYSRRLSPRAMEYISHLLAWGDDNVELLQGYPALGGTPVHATGNPRNDFLRPELREFFAGSAETHRAEFGDFLLVATNYNHVNSFYPGQNLVVNADAPGEEPQFGRAARGMTPEYALGLRAHKQVLFEHFQRLIPFLEERFPQMTIVVRPHPTENHEAYRQIAARCTRVRVNNEGNVVGWLLAARALVHNGCTTGVEAYVLRVPAVSYRPAKDDRYDEGFYRLPNLASHQCFEPEELIATLRRIVSGELGPAGGAERKAIVDHYLTAQEQPLAVERIVTLLEDILGGPDGSGRPALANRLRGRFDAARRRWRKLWQGRRAGAQSTPEFHRHRFPELRIDEVRARLANLQRVLHDETALEVVEIRSEIFGVRRSAARGVSPDRGTPDQGAK